MRCVIIFSTLAWMFIQSAVVLSASEADGRAEAKAYTELKLLCRMLHNISESSQPEEQLRAQLRALDKQTEVRWKSERQSDEGIANRLIHYTIVSAMDDKLNVAEIDEDIQALSAVPDKAWAVGMLLLVKVRAVEEKVLTAEPYVEKDALEQTKRSIAFLEDNIDKIRKADDCPRRILTIIGEPVGCQDYPGAMALWYIAVRYQRLGDMKRYADTLGKIMSKYPHSEWETQARSALSASVGRKPDGKP